MTQCDIAPCAGNETVKENVPVQYHEAVIWHGYHLQISLFPITPQSDVGVPRWRRYSPLVGHVSGMAPEKYTLQK